ncbi:S-adenosyl-L-methionine-dependent methyltransferase [Mariannaea sp. PMI_226]|nr:S-adenosyl-L-methionine-dependent methyltransferase [Mariannaea sp. PMI_226]
MTDLPIQDSSSSWDSASSLWIPHHAANVWRFYFPIKNEELEMEDIKGHIAFLVCEDLILAPVKDQLDGSLSTSPVTTVDLGCGSGFWAIDVADTFPDVNVLGIDCVPRQPHWVPPNCSFWWDDVESDWTSDSRLVYIHALELALAINDWPRLLSQAYNNLEHGGWIELKYFDYHPRRESFNAGKAIATSASDPMSQFWEVINYGLSVLGVDHTISEAGHILSLVEKAGFQHAVEREFNVPIGRWSQDPKLREVGEFCAFLVSKGAHIIADMPLRVGLGWHVTAIKQLVSRMRDYIYSQEAKIHQPYLTFRVVYAMKPV